ncbi:cilia- and flagella-associated protein 157-like [Syngnathus scovelli]|uniref:cilia- and flagella-associated protein 157-like n=1 Tax=Syngnathus scovelli TaxID=161590 RepID=UPI0021108068|nr:cilia- and flagella-associated protein 157-like [Syngnathus scovelli]
MPKKEQKQEADKKTKKTPSQVTPAEEREPGDKAKDLYRLQIRLLNDELDRQQLKCERLEQEKTSLVRRCVHAETEKKEAVEYLKTEMLDKEDQMEQLAERLDQSLREAQAERNGLRGRQAEELRELRDRIHQLEEDNAALVARLEAVKTFEEEKQQLKSDVVAAQKNLADREREHAAVMYTVEMKAVMDKTRLEKELKTAAEAAAVEVERLVEQKLPEASKEAVLEKQEAWARYARLSDKAQQLARENLALRQQRGRNAADVAILEETINKMARQSCFRKKVAEQHKADLAERSWDLEQLRTQLDQSHAELEALRKKHTTTCGHLKAELQEERKRIGLMRDAVAAMGPRLTPHTEKLLKLLEGPLDPLLSDPTLAGDNPANQGAESGYGQLGPLTRHAPKAKRAPPHR